MLITVLISAVQTHTPDADADEMSNSHRSPSLNLIPDSSVDHPCCRKPHGSLWVFVASHWLERSY